MKKVVIVILLLGLALSQIKVELEKTIIKDSASKYEDQVYTKKALYNDESDKVAVIFDTTTPYNWRTQAVAPTGAATTDTVSILDRSYPLTSLTTSKDTFSFDQTTVTSLTDYTGVLGTAPVAAGWTVKYSSDWSKTVTNGLGLDGKSDFLTTLSSQVNLAVKGFSFFIHECSNTVIFGEPEGYFAKNLPTICPRQQLVNGAATTNTANVEGLWALSLTQISIAGANSQGEQWNTFDSTHATVPTPVTSIFDTNTDYIWVNEATFNFITSTLGQSVQCFNTGGTGCPCKNSDAPKVFFTFDCNKQDNKFGLSYEQYVKKTPASGENCDLVFKKLETGATALPYFRLGYSWFNGVYTFFDAKNDNIALSESYDVQCQPKLLDDTSRVAYIVAGLLIALLAIMILVSSMQKVPYNPAAHVKTPPKDQSRPVFIPPPQQRIILSQSPVRTVVQPVYQQQAPMIVSTVGQSPIYRPY